MKRDPKLLSPYLTYDAVDRLQRLRRLGNKVIEEREIESAGVYGKWMLFWIATGTLLYYAGRKWL